MSRPIGCLLLFAVVLLATTFNLVHAAEIRRNDTKFCAFALEGPIVAGDHDRLAGLISSSHLDPLDERRSTSLCLKSPGGSYVEGLKIAELIYNRGFSTVVADGSECFSACAIIFMAGVVSENAFSDSVRQIGPFRNLSAGGVLGFHAPYLSMPDEKYSREQVENATQSMRKAILGLAEFSSKETTLNGGDLIKKSLLAGILEKGPQDVLFVKTIGDAARWDIHIYDAAEQFPKEFGVAMAGNIGVGLQNLCNNFHYSNMDKAVPRYTHFSLKLERWASKYPPNYRVLVQDSKTKDTVCEIYPMPQGRDGVKFLACSHDYWSSKSFGDCREYKTAVPLMVGAKDVPNFFTLDPFTPLKKFKN